MSPEAAAYFSNVLANATETTSSSLISTEPLKLGGSDQPLEASRLPAANIQVSPASDEELMEQVRQGSREHLSVLFRKYARAVRNIAQRILRDEAEADDLLQEVFLFIFRKASLFDPSQGSAATWIIHVAYHRAFDRRRYLASRHFYTSQDLETHSPNLVDRKQELQYYERSVEGLWGREAAEKLKALLSEDQRTTFDLYFFDGHSLKEIAELTGQSLVSVRHHYYRGLEKIRKSAIAKILRSK